MTGIYSRPLSVLREIHRQLNNDLADIDLYSLRYETQHTPSDEITKGKWIRLLNMVSPLLVSLGRELDQANDAVERQIFSTQAMMGMLSLTMMVVVLIVTFMIVVSIDDSKTIIGLTEAVLQVLFVFLVVGMLARVLVISIGEQIHYLEHEKNTAVHQALRFFKNELSENDVIKKAAKKITGEDSSTTPTKQVESVPAEIVCGSDDPKHVPTVDEVIEITCTKDRERVLVALQHLKNNYDRFDKIAIVTSIQSRFNFLTRLFEKSSANKYANKTTIPSIVRTEIAPLLSTRTIELHMLVPDDKLWGEDVSAMGGIKESLVSTTRHETKAGAWRTFSEGATRPTHVIAVFVQHSQDSTRGVMYVLNSFTPLETLFKYRRKNAVPRVANSKGYSDRVFVAMNMPLENQKISISGSVPAKTDIGALGFELIGVKRNPTGCANRPDCNATMGNMMLRFVKDELTLRNVFDQVDDVEDSAEHATLSVRMDTSALYTQSIMNGDMSGRFLLEQKEFIAIDIAGVVHKYEFSFELSSNRKAIETELMKFYGAIYETHMRRIVMSILRLADAKVADMRKSPLSLLASEHDLRNKVMEMTDAEWVYFLNKVLPISDHMKDQQNNFPRFFSWRGKRIRTTIMGFLVPIAVIILLIAFTMILDGFISNLTSSFWDTFAIAIFIPAVIAVAITVFETLAKKSISVMERHYDVLKQNSSEMIGSTSLAISYLIALRKKAFQSQGAALFPKEQEAASADSPAAINDPTSTDPSGAVAADGMAAGSSLPPPPRDAAEVNAAKMAIIKFHDAVTNFRRCNNLGLNDSSYDSLAELVLYAIVFVVFLLIAVYVAMKLDPMSSIDKIKQLANIRNLIDSGEIHPNMFGDAFDMSACMVPVAPAIWVLKLFGAVIFLCLTIWFMAVSQGAEDSLKEQIDGMRDCNKILSV